MVRVLVTQFNQHNGAHSLSNHQSYNIPRCTPQDEMVHNCGARLKFYSCVILFFVKLWTTNKAKQKPTNNIKNSKPLSKNGKDAARMLFFLPTRYTKSQHFNSLACLSINSVPTESAGVYFQLVVESNCVGTPKPPRRFWTGQCKGGYVISTFGPICSPFSKKKKENKKKIKILRGQDS